MKVGVYVGSFNPPHIGHLKVANYLIENKIVDKVLMLPTLNYWDKQDLVDLKDRIAMLKYYETKDIVVDDIHNNYEFTYQVLNALKKDYKSDTLYLIMGYDNLKNLHLWKNIDEILENKIIVLRRGNIDIDKYLNRFDKSKFIIIDNFDYVDISSTELRKTLDSKYLNEKVVKYIKGKKLY